MKPITDQQRLEIYRNAPEEIREIYVSDQLIEHIDHLILLFEITNPYKDVSDIVADTILGFYKIADMPKLFQQKLDVSADVSQKMTSQLIEFLSVVVKREQEEATSKKESVATLTQTFATPAVPIQATPEVPKPPVAHITQMRTMQTDLNRIHGYGAYQQSKDGMQKEETVATSSQDELLGKK